MTFHWICFPADSFRPVAQWGRTVRRLTLRQREGRVRRVRFGLGQNRDRDQDQPRGRSQPSPVHASKPVRHRHQDPELRRPGLRLHQASLQARSQWCLRSWPEASWSPERGLRPLVEPQPERPPPVCQRRPHHLPVGHQRDPKRKQGQQQAAFLMSFKNFKIINFYLIGLN